MIDGVVGRLYGARTYRMAVQMSLRRGGRSNVGVSQARYSGKAGVGGDLNR